MTLQEITDDEHQISSILNALWKAMFPHEGTRPENWLPFRSQVRDLEIGKIGLGQKGRQVVEEWLRADRKSSVRSKRAQEHRPPNW
jgi:hypothetical protein